MVQNFIESKSKIIQYKVCDPKSTIIPNIGILRLKTDYGRGSGERRGSKLEFLSFSILLIEYHHALHSMGEQAIGSEDQSI